MDYSTLQSRVLSRINMGSDDPSATLVDEYVNEALHYIETASPDGWPWLRYTTTLTTTAGTSTYSFPTIGALIASGTLISKVLSAKVLRGSNYYDPMKLLSPEEAHQLYPSTNQAIPEGWFAEGEILYLYPTPDAAYSVVLRVIIQEKDLSYTTATPAIPSVYHAAVVETATMLYYQTLQETQRAERAQAAVDRWILRMKSHGREYTSAPKVRVRDWLA